MKLRALILAIVTLPACAQQLPWSVAYNMETLSAPWIAPTGVNANFLPATPATFCSGVTNQGTGGQANYCQQMTNIAPYLDGFLIPIRWPIGYNSEFGGIDTGIELNTVPVSNPPPAAQYNFTNLDKTVLAPLTSFTCAAKIRPPGHPCWFAFKLGPSQAGQPNTPNAPDYTYQYGTGSWADAVCPLWVTGTTYLANQCVQWPLGTFYQDQDGTFHTATGNSGPLSDGGSWSAALSHAPPLDVGSNTTQNYTANTLPCSTGNSATCPAISNINIANCGTGTQACSINTLEAGTEAIWETPLATAWINALNALNNFIATKSYASDYKYGRGGLFTDGTSFNPSETSLQTLTGNSQSNLETVVAKFYGMALPLYKQSYHAAGALQDCVAAGNTTTQDTQLQTACSSADMMGSQGIQNNDLLHWWNNSGLTTNNWVGAIQTYGATMLAFHFQPISGSNTTHCVPLVTDSGFYCSTFMLPMLSMLRNSGKPWYYEIFQGEADCAFDGTTNDAGCNSTAPNSAWAQAIIGATQGVPAPLTFGLGVH